VVRAMVVESGVAAAGHVGRGVNARDVGALRQAGEPVRNILPGTAVVTGYLEVSVIGSDVELAGGHGRFSDCRDFAVARHAVVQGEYRPAGHNAHQRQLGSVGLGGEVDRSPPGVAAVL